MKVETSRFGSKEVGDDELYSFPEGFPGFDSDRFFMVPISGHDSFCWLQSADDPDLAFLVADPFLFVPEYRAGTKPAELGPVEPDAGPLKPWVIVRRGETPEELIVNLFAPVIVNETKHLAMQLPLVGSGYAVRAPWPPRPEPVAPPAAR